MLESLSKNKLGKEITLSTKYEQSNILHVPKSPNEEIPLPRSSVETEGAEDDEETTLKLPPATTHTAGKTINRIITKKRRHKKPDKYTSHEMKLFKEAQERKSKRIRKLLTKTHHTLDEQERNNNLKIIEDLTSKGQFSIEYGMLFDQISQIIHLFDSI